MQNQELLNSAYVLFNNIRYDSNITKTIISKGDNIMSNICCCKILSATSVVLAGAVINITVAPTNVRNKERKILCIGTIPFPNVPFGTNPQIQVIGVNGNTPIPVIDCLGNPVTAADVGCDRSWLVAYGTGGGTVPAHLTAFRGIRNTKQCKCNDGYIPA